ncbi:DoxX family protein [Metapseudomonas furukawaii]|uniref:Membrane protein n=1 Tax=Metapseudomonas furukawaii TaxID=1149133 RepID=A0AAD1BZK1_METFU|nr:DoxX family protein [Pseudomonas furukawaii]ELS27488.1 Membrane protein, thiosulfate:quinone oxidoreductase DoxD like protein [Pseudomonas furukawaii]BAU74075.1 membrane protein [Pseudomonas furukawaii]
MSSPIKSVLATNAGYGITLLRVVTGLTFMAHGAQKLFGMFGGYGLTGTGQWMESIGLAPGYLMALMAGSAEFFGGLALVIGLLVRPAALSLVVAMVVAIFSVHWASGFFITNGGYEYALILGLISATLLIEGAGKLSLDSNLAK